jgi:hypothetical protein
MDKDKPSPPIALTVPVATFPDNCRFIEPVRKPLPSIFDPQFDLQKKAVLYDFRSSSAYRDMRAFARDFSSWTFFRKESPAM